MLTRNSMRWHTVVFVSVSFGGLLSALVSVDEAADTDPDIDPYNVREEGCPVVSDRDNLDIHKLIGNWTLPFASLNWLADIGMSLYNNSVKMSQITSICPKIVIDMKPSRKNRNAHWIIRFICPKLKGEFEIWCWRQTSKAKSKFICWNDKENRDMYLMVAATDHKSWIVVIRCSPKEEAKLSEGMSWAIFSKVVDMDPNISDVLFGLLEGYGFDVKEFKTQLLYNSCPS